MTKLVIALVIVAAVLIAGLVKLFRSSNQPMGSPEVLERARQRNRELEAEERRDAE